MPAIHPLLLFINITLLTTILWISQEFGHPDIGQIAFYSQSESLKNVAFSPSIIKNFFIFCLALPLIATTVITLFSIELRPKLQKIRFFNIFIAKKLPIYLFTASIILANSKFGIYDYLKNSFSNDNNYFAKNFINSAKINIKPSKKPKSLVLIYLESIEKNYENTEIFTKNPLKNLNKHKKLSFANYFQIFPNGKSSTIAGIIATQCAIPLKSSLAFAGIDFSKIKLNSFLPKVTCLGDSLKKLGYKNIFLGGADLRFANKGAFLKTHGYDEIYGKKHWLRLNPRQKMNSWGLYDKELFAKATKKLDQLMQNDQPFNLTILTLDTHNEGHSHQGCNANFSTKIRCSTNQIAKFITHIKNKGYLNKINIVITSDHLANNSPLHQKLTLQNPRKLYNSWISNTEKIKKTEFLTTLDLAPTIIEFLGHDIVENRYNLGYSAFSTSIKKARIDSLRQNIPKKSQFYMDLWQNETKSHKKY